jgi:hypothetical protein
MKKIKNIQRQRAKKKKINTNSNLGARTLQSIGLTIDLCEHV